MDIFDLSGKVAVVTGANMGLGRAMAVGLSQAGAKVVATDIEDVVDTAAEIRKSGGEVLENRADVREEDDVKRMVAETVGEFGKIDILVNNAAVFGTVPVEDTTQEYWDNMMAVNMRGTFLCSRMAGEHMIAARSGKIINMSSITGQVGYPDSAAYNASKAGVILFTKTLAVEWGRHDINVNAICPAYFVTTLTSDHIEVTDSEQIERVRTSIPLGGARDPKEIVGTAIYLASSASDYVTGHTLVIDGGWTAGLV